MLYFKSEFWYDIGVDCGAEYFPRSIVCGKYTIYSMRRIYAVTIYRVRPTCVGMCRLQTNFATVNRSSSHMRGNESLPQAGVNSDFPFIPRRWEWVDQIGSVFAVQKVYPTRVGMSRSVEAYAEWLLCLSHVSGNDSKLSYSFLRSGVFILRE